MAQRFSKLKSLFLLLGPKAFIQKHFTCDAEGRHLLRHRFLRRSGLPPPSSRLDAQERERASGIRGGNGAKPLRDVTVKFLRPCPVTQVNFSAHHYVPRSLLEDGDEKPAGPTRSVPQRFTVGPRGVSRFGVPHVYKCSWRSSGNSVGQDGICKLELWHVCQLP